MFLQSQKKKSNIKYKTSEKPKKKKSKGKSKIKPKPKPEPEPEPEPEPPVTEEKEELPIPSEIRPVINQPPMHQPEMPAEVFSEPKPFDNSSDVEKNLRFNNRQNAKFGIEEEESEGPDLFVNVDNKTDEVSSFPNKTDDFVSMGNKGTTGKTEKGTPFDSDGIFGEFDMSKRKSPNEYKAHNSHFRKTGQGIDERKVTSEMHPKNSFRGKKKKLVNIFENPNENENSDPKPKSNGLGQGRFGEGKFRKVKHLGKGGSC